MIRDAKNVDIPAIVMLLHEGFSRSHYAGKERGEIDTVEAKRMLMQAIQRHGHKTGGGCFVQVAETDGVVTGVILGTLQRIYGVGTKLLASDVFWLASTAVHPGDPMKLMANMIAWAKSSPHCIEIKCAVTEVINADVDASGLILERLGMQKYGTIYRLET